VYHKESAVQTPSRVRIRCFLLAGLDWDGFDWTMKMTMIRGFALSALLALFLSGCSSKKLEAKVKQLETEMEEFQTSHDEAIARQDQTISEKSAALDEANNKSREKISELTSERDRLTYTVKELQNKLDSIQAEAKARKPNAGSADSDGPDLAKDPKFSDAMVSIVGDVTKSVGVVIDDGGKRYIYTSGDTLGGNTRLTITNASGTKFTKFGSLQTSENYALVRIELLEEGVPSIPLATSDEIVGSQSNLYCLSLSPGAGGAATGGKLRAYNQTDNAVECDASLLTGKAGAAIVDTDTGKIVAVVVNQTGAVSTLWERVADLTEVQAAGLRVNKAISWQPVPIKAFLDESGKIRNFNRMTRLVEAFAGMTPSADGLGMSGAIGEGGTVLSVLSAASDVQIAAEAVALDADLAQKKIRLGEADLKKRLKGFFSSVVSQSKASMSGFVPGSFSSYHRKLAEQSLTWRTEADQKLKKTAEGVDTLSFSKPTDRKAGQKVDNNW